MHIVVLLVTIFDTSDNLVHNTSSFTAFGEPQRQTVSSYVSQASTDVHSAKRMERESKKEVER